MTGSTSRDRSPATDGPSTPTGTPTTSPSSQKAQRITVTPDDIDIPSSTAAIIDSKSLAQSLIRNQDETLRVLSEGVAPIDVDEITIDKYGRVVIDNQKFREALLVALASPGPEGNNVLAVCTNTAGCLKEM